MMVFVVMIVALLYSDFVVFLSDFLANFDGFGDGLPKMVLKTMPKIDKYEKTSQKFATFLAKTVQIGKIFGMIAVLLVFLGSSCKPPSPSLLRY